MLDLLLLLVLLIAGLLGWQRGLISSALGLACFVIGVIVGLRLAPLVLTLTGLDAAALAARVGIQLLVVFVVVVILTSLGEALARVILRVIGVAPVRWVDSILGAVASVVVTALALWLVTAALRPVLPPAWAASLSESRVLAVVDSAMPQAAQDIPDRFGQMLQASGFPEVFAGQVEPRLQAPAPTGEGADTVAVREAGDSILKIRSASALCRGLSAGSGWTVAPERVVTNAHVVAGGESISVQVGGQGPRREATVVSYDPGLDLAILAVPGLDAEPLPRTGRVEAGTEGVVAGFPEGGSYTLTPARIGPPLQARGLDIYHGDAVVREIYPLRADVRNGDSGGPLLTTGGAVAGTVFARSTDQAATGYALTDAATTDRLDQAASLNAPVSTGDCLVRPA